MQETREELSFEEVLDNEIDDIWDIFFPYMSEKKETIKEIGANEKTKPRRYLKFLSM